MKNLILYCSLFIYSSSFAQNTTKKVLFIGNSYTSVNNLPKMVADVSKSVGDNLIYEDYAPGGYTFKQQSSNKITIDKISKGNWDYVVLQEQSQYPSFPISQVENEVYPYAKALDSVIRAKNPCAETVFYMTWGRKNGDASNCQFWPPVCTYSGMDSLLNLRYRAMANDNQAILSAVGAVWNYIIKNNPSINLYSADESHPSVEGTYAAACTFYASLFRKNPELITFYAGLDSNTVKAIQNAVKIVIYDDLMEWNIGKYDLKADFTFTNSGNHFTFQNNTKNADTYLWEFGDDSSSTDENPKHVYLKSGKYDVKLFVTHCGVTDSVSQQLEIQTTGVLSNQVQNLVVYPNPASEFVYFDISNMPSAKEVLIFDVNGKQVLNHSFTNGNQLDIRSLSKGFYMYKIIGNENTSSGKLILE